MSDKLTQQQKDATTAIANASRLVRDAVAAALPVAPDQYLTISIPGTVVDTNDIAKGGTYVYDVETTPFVPTAVQQAESKLVDGMMPLANVMLGNTGKSVSRSYSTALDFLLPKKATVSTQNQIRSPGEASYEKAFKYLTSKNADGRTPVEVYIEKQAAWTKAQNDWDIAKIEAKNQAKLDHPGDNAGAVQQFDDWTQEHYRRFKNDVQAHFIDWVTNGDKYNVEFNFGIVDVDSVMSRIERSKQSMRDSTIVDTDGADELQLVSLTPKNWATLCRQKVDNFYQTNGNFSIDQVIAEINRLQKLQQSLEALQTDINAKKYPKANAVEPTTKLEDAKNALKTAYQNLYDAQGALNGLAPGSDAKQAKSQVQTSQQALATALDAWEDVAEQWVKYNLSTAGSATWLQGILDTVKDQITKLQQLQSDKTKTTSYTIAPIIGAHAPAATDANGTPTSGDSGNDAAAIGSELADPIFGISGPTGVVPPTPSTSEGAGDVWTRITASFSAEDQQSTTTQSSWGMSVSAGFGWGLWSAGGSYAHEESDSDYKSAMAKCNVSVSFSALVVNVNRPWLYAELFDDYELDTATDAFLSPGPEDLQGYIAKQSTDRTVVTTLAKYNTFPAFPTAFIVAADVVLEFTGETKNIETHFHSSSNSGSAHFGWGPFSVGGSFHQSSSRSDFHMQTTATGVKISFAAPQIIAWVSQILPALPRKAGVEPMVQGSVS